MPNRPHPVIVHALDVYAGEDLPIKVAWNPRTDTIRLVFVNSPVVTHPYEVLEGLYTHCLKRDMSHDVIAHAGFLQLEKAFLAAKKMRTTFRNALRAGIDVQ